MYRAKRAVLLAACCLAGAAPALAQSPLNATISMRDNLTALATSKTAVTVVLKNGDSYRAKIGAVGDHQVVLTEGWRAISLLMVSVWACGPSRPWCTGVN